MTVKLTTTEVEAKNGKLELLFEFMDRELPEEFDIDYMTQLGKSKYIGSLQTAQIQGVYLEPLVLKGTFRGDSIMLDGTKITAKERSDQLGRLQLRPIKFFFENFKQIVIIEHYKRKIKNYNEIEYELTMFPHDIQNPVKPSLSKKLNESSKNLADTTGDGEKFDKKDNDNLNKFLGDFQKAGITNLKENKDTVIQGDGLPSQDRPSIVASEQLIDVKKVPVLSESSLKSSVYNNQGYTYGEIGSGKDKIIIFPPMM